MSRNHKYIKKKYKNWAVLQRRANEKVGGGLNACEFLYRRALVVALEHLADWVAMKPERSLGMVVVSYQNLADVYGRYQQRQRQIECLLDAYDLLSSYMTHHADEHLCLVASQYLEVVVSELLDLNEQAERFGSLEQPMRERPESISAVIRMENL